MNEDQSEGPVYRQGESLYLYEFEHPTVKGGVYMIYAHSQKEAEDAFRKDWEHQHEPKFLRRTQW